MLVTKALMVTSALLSSSCPFSKEAGSGALLPPGHPELAGTVPRDSVSMWLGTGERIGLQTQPPPGTEELPAVDFGSAVQGSFSRRVLALRSGAQFANVTARTTGLLRGGATSADGPILQVFQQGFLYQHYHPKHRGLDRQQAGVALPGYLPETVLPMPPNGFALAAERTSNILLELWIPQAAATGLYTGFLIVSGYGSGAGYADFRRKLNVSVRVVPASSHGTSGGISAVAGVVQRSLGSDLSPEASPPDGRKDKDAGSGDANGLHAAASEYLQRGADIQQQRWNMFLGVHNIPAVPFCSVATGSLFRWCT